MFLSGTGLSKGRSTSSLIHSTQWAVSSEGLVMRLHASHTLNDVSDLRRPVADQRHTVTVVIN